MEGLWIDGLYIFSHALQAIRNGDENILNASGLQPVNHGHPEACALILGDPMPRTSRVPSVRTPIPR